MMDGHAATRGVLPVKLKGGKSPQKINHHRHRFFRAISTFRQREQASKGGAPHARFDPRCEPGISLGVAG